MTDVAANRQAPPSGPFPDGWRERSPIPELLARVSFPAPGGSVDLGVSGGADSTALLVLAVAAGLDVRVHHVDHGLRAASGDDASVVVELCGRLDIPVTVHHAALADGPNLEDRARRTRRALLPARVLLGHTADDQAETVLLALLRGAGPDGVGAMSPQRRPLLALRRHETRAVCEAVGVAPLVDGSNSDPRFRRNRVRRELLPLLDDIAGRDVVPLLARFADIERATVESLDATLAGVDPTDTAALRERDDVAVARLLRRWWRETTGVDHAPDHAATLRMIDVVRGVTSRCDVVSGWRLARTSGRLRLERQATAHSPEAGGDTSDR